MIRIVQVCDVVIIFGKGIPGLKEIIQAQSVKITGSLAPVSQWAS